MKQEKYSINVCTEVHYQLATTQEEDATVQEEDKTLKNADENLTITFIHEYIICMR